MEVQELIRTYWDEEALGEAWQDLSRLITRKRTPFLALHRGTLRRWAGEFQRFSPRLQVFYAVKANPHPALLRELASLNIGFEISSEKELALLLRQGIAPERMVSGNPVKSPGFINKAQHLGMDRFVFDSAAEVEKLARFAPGSAGLVRLAVSNQGAIWPLDQKFGVERGEALELLQYAQDRGLHPLGIAFHVGSQCLQPASWEGALFQASRLYQEAGRQGIRLNALNIGGGFPARYDGPAPLVSAILSSVIRTVERLFPREVSLWAEPGRALVAEAGIMVATILGKKMGVRGNYLFTDIGAFNGLGEALGGIRYSFATDGQGEERLWAVAGPTCDGLDIIGKEVWLPEPEVGDKLFIAPGGAYTTAYASSFNGARVPGVYLL